MSDVLYTPLAGSGPHRELLRLDGGDGLDRREAGVLREGDGHGVQRVGKGAEGVLLHAGNAVRRPLHRQRARHLRRPAPEHHLQETFPRRISPRQTQSTSDVHPRDLKCTRRTQSAPAGPKVRPTYTRRTQSTPAGSIAHPPDP
eukprot:1195797-Prorocentrum_minimum.AAC.12